MANAVLKTPADRGSMRRVAHASRINANPAKYEWQDFACLTLISPLIQINLMMTLSNAKRERIRLLLIVQALRLMRSAWADV